MTGNGLFLLGMAKRKKDWNFLGLEINEKVFFIGICTHFATLLTFITKLRLLNFLSACKALSRFCSTTWYKKWVRFVIFTAKYNYESMWVLFHGLTTSWWTWMDPSSISLYFSFDVWYLCFNLGLKAGKLSCYYWSCIKNSKFNH